MSSKIPGLLLQVSSSILGTFKECPRKGLYRVIEARRSREGNPDADFGTLVHEGLERYEAARGEGRGHEEAVELVVDFALQETWDFALHRPLDIGQSPKNREGLIRTLVWYLDKYKQDLPTLVLSDGTPAVELRFEFDSGFTYASTGEGVTFCGKLDKLVELNGQPYILDRKTTKYGLGGHYFRQYSPGNQFSFYTLAGRIAFGLEVKGVICDAIQVGQGWTRFERQLIERPKEVVEEWLEDAYFWLGEMERCAVEGKWPQNDANCMNHGRMCEFAEICSMSPRARGSWLKRDFPGDEAVIKKEERSDVA